MSLLAALGLELERVLLPANGLAWRADLAKLPPQLPGGHYELPGGGLEGSEGLTGDCYCDWLTERVDFAAFLPEPAVPSPPPPDLEAMASLLKKELEQMEDYFLDETLPPDQAAPTTPPSHDPPAPGPFPFPEAPLALAFPHLEPPPGPALETLDSGCLELLTLWGAAGGEGLPGPPPPAPRRPRPAPYAPGPPPAPPKSDRKQKKRDQNKTAALRYRQRKRAEFEALDDECQGLEARNRELREKADSIEREIQYVKDLLIEVYKARSQRLRSP
ncbi:cyclic AMP-dependent transcription factor ATF-5 [Ornithorhynchus anatinus]|nr:cyclic AMP-dependent transcription factor ATF-5 [Ornithorhynchus anatinus]